MEVVNIILQEWCLMDAKAEETVQTTSINRIRSIEGIKIKPRMNQAIRLVLLPITAGFTGI